MSAVVWCDLSATVCGAEYSDGMPAARVRAKDDGYVWTAWNERGKRLGLGGGYAKLGEAMAAAERQIDAAQAALLPDSAPLTGPAEAATAREGIEDAALAGTYERPRPRTSRDVVHAAPAPLPAGRLPTPEAAAMALVGGEIRPGDDAQAAFVGAALMAIIVRDAAILARLDAVTRALAIAPWNPGEAVDALDALRAELRGGAT